MIFLSGFKNGVNTWQGESKRTIIRGKRKEGNNVFKQSLNAFCEAINVTLGYTLLPIKISKSTYRNTLFITLSLIKYMIENKKRP